MVRLIKYVKPYLLMVLVTIALLFVQANADLALPDYLSRIVNIGIQQSGIENAVPIAIRARQMDRLLLFIAPADQERVLDAYALVDADSADYETTLETVPGVSNEPVYVLTTEVKDELAWLNPVMAKALLAVSGIEQGMADPSKAAQMGAAGGFDLTQIPPGTDLFALLANLPESKRNEISTSMQDQFTALGDGAIEQAAVRVVKSEYEALGIDMNRLQTGYVVRVGLLMLLVSLVSVIAVIAVSYLSGKTGAGLGRDMRRDVFKKVESFNGAEFEKFSTASLITRTTNDITQIQMVVIMMLRMVFYAPIVGVGGIIRAIDKGSSMWWIIAVAVAILLSLVVVVFSISLPKFKIMQDLIDRLNLVVRENLSGMMVIRAFNMQPFEEQRFDKSNKDLTANTLFINRVMVAMFPIMMLIMNGLSILIIWVGAHQVAQAQMQVGDMMAFMQYAIQIVFSFLMMSFMFIILPRASVSGRRIAEVLDTPIAVVDPQKPRKFPSPFKGELVFRNVSFRYPGADEDVLCNINFTARPGQTTAFIGSTGSGKSTIVNLIPRFFDVTGGQILLDGVDIREVTQHDLREKIGYIPQRSILFSGTINTNLRYADENATEEALLEAAGTAQVRDFIEASPEGLEAAISQGGANVSGGQKQRLSIARALVKKAPIYIFDDSFSALDFKTDAALRRALKETTANSVLLLITQRVSTVMNAEQIVVLDNGQVAGIGTHTELMKSCETYREIAMSQLSLEELS